MTDYTYSKVAVYAELGGALRLARNSRAFATDPVTGVPINVTQGAFTAPYLDTDSSGIADFTATTPGPIRLTTGATFVDVYSEEMPALGFAAVTSAAASAVSASASAADAAASASLVGAPADTAVAAIFGNPASATRIVTDADYAPTLGPRPYYLDAYNAFFLNAGAWVTGQGTTSTTLTAQATAGATVMAVTSGASFVNGTSIITNPGTATQQIYKVTSGGGTASLTITPNIVTTIASGATISPLWTNSSHLTVPDGFNAFAYFIANAKKVDGTFVITDPGSTRPVVFLGDSWFSNGGTVYAAQINARFPSAVVVNAGVSGNNSNNLIARFGTDVATNAAYVIIDEPGVNDIAGGVLPETIAANLETLIGLIRGIGATPIITGMVPLSDWPGQSAAQSVALIGQTSTGTQFPAASTSALLKRINASVSAYSFGIGPGVQPFMTGVNNTAVGYYAQRALTTGTNNTAIGALAQNMLTTGASNMALGNAAQAVLSTGGNNTAVGDTTQHALTTGANNTAVGQAAQYVLTSGSHNTAIGDLAQFAATTLTGCTAIGHQAQYSPGGVAGNATTTAYYQTSIGYQSGQGSASQVNYITTIGYRTTAAAHGGVAIGADSGGTPAAAVAQDEVALGTALHTTRLRGWLQLDKGQTTVGAAGAASALPATPTKYLSVKDSTGTEYVMPVYAKV